MVKCIYWYKTWKIPQKILGPLLAIWDWYNYTDNKWNWSNCEDDEEDYRTTGGLQHVSSPVVKQDTLYFFLYGGQFRKSNFYYGSWV